MDRSILGTGGLVLAKAGSAYQGNQVTPAIPNGCDQGGCIVPVAGSCLIDGSSARLNVLNDFFTFRWAPPSGSPADFPLSYTFNSFSTGVTELGKGWAATYHRFAEPVTTINPPPISVNTPIWVPVWGNNGTSYSAGAPNQNTLVGNSTTGWTETQPNGTAFVYDGTGVLRTIRNRAGVRWTVTWDGTFSLVQGIVGPFGRRTSFAYDASSHLKRIQDPGGRITTVTVNASNQLTRVISPALCITSFVYSGSNMAWVNPLGDRTTIVGSAAAIVQPMGQRTSLVFGYVNPYENFAIVNPRGARTTFYDEGVGGTGIYSTDPFGNQIHYGWNYAIEQPTFVTDARGVQTSFTYQLQNNGSYRVTGIRKKGYNSGTGHGQYNYLYNNNNQVKAVVGRAGQPLDPGVGQQW